MVYLFDYSQTSLYCASRVRQKTRYAEGHGKWRFDCTYLIEVSTIKLKFYARGWFQFMLKMEKSLKLTLQSRKIWKRLLQIKDVKNSWKELLYAIKSFIARYIVNKW